MRLDNISLGDFRNYVNLQLDFDPGVNLIVGDNAQGKTNLLEAIAYLGSGKSFRAQRTAELVRFGAEFADIEGSVTAQERQQSVRWVLFPAHRPRMLYRNGAKKKTAADVAGLLPSVLFCPEDLQVLKAGAAQRRRLGDHALCDLRPNYDAALAEYHRILEHKSRILKDKEEDIAVLAILPEYNARLCQVGAMLISYRARFYDSLGKAAAKFHQQFSGGLEEFSLQYKTVSTVTDPFAPLDVLRSQLEEHLESHHRAELSSMQCLTGPHKDDFDVTLNGISLKSYGSQGQTRTAAISLKLAQRELMASQWGEEPLLLLDDVLSELDPKRQDFILNQIDRGQVFITCCEPGRFTKLGKTIHIENGTHVM
ncbi:MAG: DNA replication/repair protein RecF [Oscillospiraceae bacterium]|nr:DNA replication/repair protein RecF [Oscillospiraceae bacterium]